MATKTPLRAHLSRCYRRWALARRVSDPDAIARRAWLVIRRQRYCLVVTEGEEGPTARMVEPLRPEQGGVIRFGTDPDSRKVAQILRSGRCLLVYQDSLRRACVSLTCEARVADGSAPVRFLDFWRAFWPDGPGTDFVNISCVPVSMEVWDGTAVIAPGPFGRRAARLERQPGGPWTLADEDR